MALFAFVGCAREVVQVKAAPDGGGSRGVAKGRDSGSMTPRDKEGKGTMTALQGENTES